MLLAVDIGNTTVSWGVLNGKRIIRVYSTEVRTPKILLRTELKKTVICIKKRYPGIQDVVLCSVVPKVLVAVEREVIRYLKIKPAVIGRDIKVPLKNNYHYPRQVGQDRLVCAYAAKTFYGQPAIIIDFGTAITFDVISWRGDYEGGMIVPGIRMSAESLSQKTALLPRINSIKAPRTLIGKDTQESILSGIFFGYGSMCCGLIEHISKRIKGKPKVIVTGGYTHLMRKFIFKKVTKVDKNLALKGIGLMKRPPVTS